jgi:hypothetical protein
VLANALLLRLCRAMALPIYAIALILSFLSDVLGGLAAKVAGDVRARIVSAWHSIQAAAD